MALVINDRVKETSTTTGTGTYNLAGAVAGFQGFVAGIGNANTTWYAASDGTDWEVGIGTVTDAAPDTLSRDTILQSSNGDAAVSWSAGTKTIVCTLPASRVVLTPGKGHIWALTMSNAADATNDITVEAGEAVSEDHEELMVLAAAITKQIDATWAVGTNAGGLNTGVVANATWYEVHLIKRMDTGVVDVMFTTTANRATLPTNYTKQRRIGWVRRGTATNLAFTQVDDHFTLTTQINDVSATATATATAVTLTAPPNSIARFRATTTSSAAVNTTNITVFSELVEGNVTPNDATGIGSIGACDVAGADGGHFELRVDGSSQIEHDSDGTTYTFDISTYGWIDHRRRMSAT